MTARRAAECDRVDNALDRSPLAPQSSTPPSSRTVHPRGCHALPTRVHPFQGHHQSPCPCQRGGPRDNGTNGPRAPTPGTGVAPPPPQWSRPWRLCRHKHTSLRAGPPPPKRGVGNESAPAPEGRLVATRAGGAGSVGLISGWGKRTATPMTARRAAECDRVDDALDRSPSAPQSSTPPTPRRRRRRPSVPGDARALLTRVHPFQGFHPSPCPRPRRRPHDQGTNGPHAPTPGTGIAPPPPQRSRPGRLRRPKHASLPAASPPPGETADHQSAPTREGRLVATRTGGAGSVGSILGRRKATATPMSAGRGAESDCVDDPLDRSLTTTQSSMLPTRRHRRRF